MRSGRRCGCATGQPWATWCISRAFGASSARGRTGRRLVWRELNLAQLVARVVRHNVVRPTAYVKHLDVLDSVRDEFGARERAGNRPMAGPAGRARRCAGRAKGDAAYNLPRGAIRGSCGRRGPPGERLIAPRGKSVAACPFSRPAQRRPCPAGPGVGRLPARSHAPNSSRPLSNTSRCLPWAIARTTLCRTTRASCSTR